MLSQKNLWIVAAASLILGWLAEYFFFDHQIGISFFLYVVLLVGALFVQFFYFKIPFNRSTLWYLVPLLFFSIMVGIRASHFLLFWNFVLTLGLLILFTNHHVGKSIKNYFLSDYLKTATNVPLTVVVKFFSSLARLFTINTKTAKSQRSSQILKGILFTLPIFVFFVVLLSSADLVFGKIVTSIFSFKVSPQFIVRFLFVAVFSCLWLGAFAHVLENASVEEHRPEAMKENNNRFGTIEAGILLGSLNVLFLIFVIIQIKYLFAGHTAITDLGFTYATYAHKGFAELILVALMSFLIVFGVGKYIERKNDVYPTTFKWMSGLMVALVLVMMASAFMRLSIYEQAYGFTLFRILVQGFILWLAAIFAWLLYKILMLVPEKTFTYGMFLSVLAFFAVFNLLNPDAFVARKNIAQFAKQGKLDTPYFWSLSSDATPEMIQLLNDPMLHDKSGGNLAKEVAYMLEIQKEGLEASKKSWQSSNFSRNRALELINQHWETIQNITK